MKQQETPVSGFYHVRIVQDDDNPIYKHIYLDGREIVGVTGVDIRMRPDELTSVAMTLTARSVEIETDANLTVNPEDVLAHGIECLNLSTRAYNALRRAGKRTVKEVAEAYVSGELREFRLVGNRTYDEIRERLIERFVVKE